MSQEHIQQPLQETQAELDEPFDRSRSHPGALMRATYGVPGWDAVKAIWWRERCAAAFWMTSSLYHVHACWKPIGAHWSCR